jgi:hypothetical protein
LNATVQGKATRVVLPSAVEGGEEEEEGDEKKKKEEAEGGVGDL